MRLREAHCRGSAPYSRLQGYLAQLLVTALFKTSQSVVVRVRSLVQPAHALRYALPTTSMCTHSAVSTSMCTHSAVSAIHREGRGDSCIREGCTASECRCGRRRC